jgi:hypothetical protein
MANLDRTSKWKISGLEKKEDKQLKLIMMTRTYCFFYLFLLLLLFDRPKQGQGKSNFTRLCQFIQYYVCTCTLVSLQKLVEGRAPICKRLRGPGIQSDRLHGLAESFPWNRFLGSLNVYKLGLRSWKNKRI